MVFLCRMLDRDLMVPPLSPTAVSQQSDHVTEIFVETDCSASAAEPAANNSRAGRRHTLGPGDTPPVSAIPPAPLKFDFKGILPQTNLPLNLPLVSNHPFADFSVKDQGRTLLS